jgi:hypothetical protein
MKMSSHRRPIVGLYGFALALCFGLLLLWSTVAVPQQQRVPVIGCLLDRSGPTAFDEALERGLREHGYIVGKLGRFDAALREAVNTALRQGIGGGDINAALRATIIAEMEHPAMATIHNTRSSLIAAKEDSVSLFH